MCKANTTSTAISTIVLGISAKFDCCVRFVECFANLRIVIFACQAARSLVVVSLILAVGRGEQARAASRLFADGYKYAIASEGTV